MALKEIQYEAATLVAGVRSGRNLDELFEKRLPSRYEAGEIAAIKNISYGVLRGYETLAWQLKFYLPRIPRDKIIYYLLLTAFFELTETRTPSHAVVHEAVENAGAVAGGAYKKLVNAVLRRFLRDDCGRSCVIPEDNLPARYNLPLWWINKTKREFPRDFESIFAAYAARPPLTLRVNRRKTTPAAYLEILREAGIEAEDWGEGAIYLPHPLPVAKIPHFFAGYVSLQDLGAQVAAPLLGAASGSYVLDACAAPGGKTGHILELADCRLLALDINARRLAKVSDNLRRLGLEASVKVADAKDIDSWWDGDAFDAILADLPCTASGVVKRHPDIRWLRREEDAAQLAAAGEELLNHLWGVLRNKGRMLIATCSVFFEENQRQLKRFLQCHENATLLTERQLLPNLKHDGFYYALVEKN